MSRPVNLTRIDIESYSVRTIGEDEDLLVEIHDENGEIYHLMLEGVVVRPRSKGSLETVSAPLSIEFTDELAAHLGYMLTEDDGV